jgi:tetratricopeptide (TPR) repeat protein
VTEDLQTACPEAEELAEYVEGRLHGRARARVEAHLAECEMCRDIVAETLIITKAEEDAPGRVVPFRPRRVLVIGGGIAALAASLFVVLQVQPELNPFRGPTPYEELVAAVGTNRTVEGRLARFEYAPFRSPTRSGSTADQRSALSYEQLAAIGRLRQEAPAIVTPEDRHERGVALLLEGNFDEAIQLIEAAAIARADNARVQNDLAVALLARGEPADIERAVSAADRASRLQPALQEPVFNRALAHERLGLRDKAIQDWEQIVRDDTSEWGTEARRRLEELQSKNR